METLHNSSRTFHNLDVPLHDENTEFGICVIGGGAAGLVVATAKCMKASDLSEVIHICPTLAQINRRLSIAYERGPDSECEEIDKMYHRPAGQLTICSL